MFAVDLHAHTRFFHGFDRLAERFDPVGVDLLTTMARRQGLDAVALTNHDYYRPLGRVGDPDGDGPVTIPGIEISTSAGHVVVIGPDPPARTEPGELAPGEAVDLARERDCAAIIAHPYRNSTVREADVSFDAIECNGKHPRTWELVETVATERDLPIVGGSDAHYPFEVGRGYTLVDADRLTPEAVVEAIREGRVEAALGTTPAASAIRWAYGKIHARKGHLLPSELAAKMEGVTEQDPREVDERTELCASERRGTAEEERHVETDGDGVPGDAR